MAITLASREAMVSECIDKLSRLQNALAAVRINVQTLRDLGAGSSEVEINSLTNTMLDNLGPYSQADSLMKELYNYIVDADSGAMGNSGSWNHDDSSEPDSPYYSEE